MPTVYITGIDDQGRSCVLERHEISSASGPLEVLRLDDAVAAVPATSPGVELLAPLTAEGGAFYNIFSWAPDQGTGLHRTVSHDVDVVLQGTVELGLEAETVRLHAGDVVVLRGHAHSWKGGPGGGIMLYSLIAGRPTGTDIDREVAPHKELDEARRGQTAASS